MHWNRRAVLAATAGLAANAASAQATVRTRSSAASPEGRRQLALMAQGVGRLRASGAWQRQIALHADMATHQHRDSWRFLPWHRAQLMWLESLIGAAVGQPFSLPYWDWTARQAPPNEVFDRRELQVPRRRVRKGQAIPAAFAAANFGGTFHDEINRFLGQPVARRGSGSPRGFAGSCELFGHNAMHGFVGGDMGLKERAPNDPLFWLHHCNVDRIWSSWSRYRRDAYPSGWGAEPIFGFETPGGGRAPRVRADQLVDTIRLSSPYAYDALMGELIVFAAPPYETVETRTLTLAPVSDDGCDLLFDAAPSLRFLSEGLGEADSLSLEAVVEVIAHATETSLFTFALTGAAGADPVRGAVFRSEHHEPSPQRLDVTSLLPGDPAERGLIRLTSEDLFERGGEPLVFTEAILSITARLRRPVAR